MGKEQSIETTLQGFSGRTLRQVQEIAANLLTERLKKSYLRAMAEMQAIFPDAKVLHVPSSAPEKILDETGINIAETTWEMLGGAVARVFPILRGAGIPVELSASEIDPEDEKGLVQAYILCNYFPVQPLEFVTKLDAPGEVAIKTVVDELKKAWVPDGEPEKKKEKKQEVEGKKTRKKK